MNSTCDVVVIGAGMAGAAAAQALRSRGATVALLEARDRLGGRIDTRWIAGSAAELGAQVLHGSADHVLGLAGGDAVVPVDRGSLQAELVDASGAHRSFGEVSEDFVPPTAMAAQLRGVARMLGPAQHTVLSTVLDGLQVSAATRTALQAWYEQVTGAAADHVPLAEICSARVYQYHGEKEQVVPAGMCTLIEAMVGGVELGFTASRVTSTATGVRVEGVQRTCDGPRERVVEAATCIVTVPPALVGSGRLVVDGMPAEQLAAARELRLTDAVAAAVPLARPAERAGFVFDVAGALGFVSWPVGGQHLTIIAKGAAAARLRRLLLAPGGLQQVVADAVPRCEVHRSTAPLVHDWGADPWATGAFTAPQRGLVALSEAWGAPVDGRVFFAGESTACASGSPFVERAFRTGVAAAAAALPLVGAGSSA